MTPATDSLAQLRAAFARICEVLGTRRTLFTARRDDGAAHIEVTPDGLYHYVVTERGSEWERRSTASTDDILYWLTEDLAFQMAYEYELAHRRAGEDCRRQLWAHELELLARVNPAWRDRRAVEIERWLAEAPYNDAQW